MNESLLFYSGNSIGSLHERTIFVDTIITASNVSKIILNFLKVSIRPVGFLQF